jgi:hypothetical protein
VLAVASEQAMDAARTLQEYSYAQMDEVERKAAEVTIDLDADESTCPACMGTIPKGSSLCPSCGLRIG